MLGGNWEHLLNAKAVEIINQRGLFLAIDLVDGDKERPIGLPKQAHQFEIGRGEFDRPSMTMTMAAASSSATRAWR